MSDRHGDLPRAGGRATDTRDLILRCLDGQASAVDAAELSSLLARDPEVARAFAQASRLESNLEIVLRGQRDQPDQVPALQPTGAPSPGRRWSIWAAGAGLATAAALLLTWSLARPRVSSETAPEMATTATTTTRFADGSTAVLRDDTSRLETRLSTATAIDLVLVKGSARFQVVPRPDRRFRIWVGAAYVEVIGTVFTVELLATGARVAVERGRVLVVSGRNETKISAGGVEVIPFDRAPDEGPEPKQDRAREHAPEHPNERVRHQAQGHAQDAQEHAQAPANERAPRVPGELRPANARRDEPGALLYASEAARRDGRPEEALTLLQSLLDRHARDPRAAYAAFILGRVLLEELARPGEAALAFARVETLDPKTPLVPDALAREVESWARAGDSDRARLRARAYLGRFPDGPRADEVRRHSRMK